MVKENEETVRVQRCRTHRIVLSGTVCRRTARRVRLGGSGGGVVGAGLRPRHARETGFVMWVMRVALREEDYLVFGPCRPGVFLEAACLESLLIYTGLLVESEDMLSKYHLFCDNVQFRCVGPVEESVYQL